MNGELAHLTKDIKAMFIVQPGDYENNLGTYLFRPTRSLAVYTLVAWVVYQLAVIDYGSMVNSATSTVKQVDWSGNLELVGIAVGIVLAYNGIRMAWPTISKAWNIFHGKVCYKLPIKSDVLDG
ncbi:MAG: hypothetical protein Q7K40_03255 [bacterium]|nr:hypothetical protein [bacterium]